MNKSKIATKSLEDLTFETMRLGRKLESLIRETYAGRDSREHFSLRRRLRHLANRNPFDGADDEDLLALRAVLEKDASEEIIGSERKFVEMGSDMHGLHGEYRDQNVYSSRGNKLLSAVTLLNDFLDKRAAALDRAAADRTVLRLISASYR